MPAVKNLLKADKARDALLRGAKQLADMVAATLGPRGRQIIIERSFGNPIITKDGVTVAKEIELKDPFENLGAQILREVAHKTNEVAGDGTTTATVIARALFEEGVRLIAGGYKATDLKAGMEFASNIIVNKIKELSKKVENSQQIAQIATISANQDTEIGLLISQAMEKIGKNGVILVEENKALETILEFTEGMQLDRGLASPYFVKDQEKQEAILDNPLVLLYSKDLVNLRDLLPILEQVAQEKRALLLIANDIEGDSLATLIMNNAKGILKCVAVRSPYDIEQLQDIAKFTGGQVICDDTGVTLASSELKHLGGADQVKVTRHKTIIVNGKGINTKELKDHTTQLEQLITEETNQFLKERMGKRLAALVGGVAILKVGAATELELREKKYRIEDALNATEAAVEEGIVPGGGLALFSISDIINIHDLDETLRPGAQLIKSAVKAPIRLILENAGLNAEVIMTELKRISDSESYIPTEKWVGFDALKEEYVDMMTAGIIDPAKVVRSALQNAVSAAILLLTTEGLIVEEAKPEETREQKIKKYFGDNA